MSRSCHSATFSTAAEALPRSTRARPATCSDLIGLRLWGIELEPFCPSANGSRTSPTSVRARWRSSVANRSSPAPASATAWSSSAWRSRATTCVETGSRSSPSRRSTRSSKSGDVAEYVPTAPEIAPTATCCERPLEPPGVAIGLEGEAGELDPERRRLGVDPVGATDAQRVHVLARTSGERLDERGASPAARARRPAAAAAPGRCRARRSRSVRSGSSGRPGPAEAASTSTNAAVSWSVTLSRSSIASTVKRRARGSPRAPRRSAHPSPRRPPPRPRASPRTGPRRTTPPRERHGCSERSRADYRRGASHELSRLRVGPP